MGLKYQLTTANGKFSFFQDKHVALQIQLEMQICFVKENQTDVVQGEVTFVNIKVDCLKMEDVIIDVKLEVLVLQVEEKVVCKQLEDMEKKMLHFYGPNPLFIPC
jgi:hypothetical protein